MLTCYENDREVVSNDSTSTTFNMKACYMSSFALNCTVAQLRGDKMEFSSYREITCCIKLTRSIKEFLKTS